LIDEIYFAALCFPPKIYFRLRDGMVDITDLKSVGIISLAGSSPAAGTILILQ
jgi:hypothetical protein